MIVINFDIPTETAKLTAGTLKAGPFDASVQVIFSGDPGVAEGLQLGLVSLDPTPELLAYTDTFATQSNLRRTALLDMSDTRLAAYMSGKAGPVPLALEFACVLNGARQSPANLSVSVQPSALTGSPVSMGGPSFPKYLAAVVGITGGGATKLDGIPTLGFGYDIVQFVDTTTNTGWRTFQRIASTAATAAPGLIRVADYNGTTNAYAWISR